MNQGNSYRNNISKVCDNYKEAIASNNFIDSFKNILDQIDKYDSNYFLSIINKINELDTKVSADNKKLTINDFLTSKEENDIKELFSNDKFNKLAQEELDLLKSENLSFSEIKDFLEKFNLFGFKQEIIKETTKSKILKALFDSSNKNKDYEGISSKITIAENEGKKYLGFKDEGFKKYYEILEENGDFLKIEANGNKGYVNKKTGEDYGYFDDVMNIIPFGPKSALFVALDEGKYRIVKATDSDYMKDERFDKKPELNNNNFFAKINTTKEIPGTDTILHPEGFNSLIKDVYYYKNLISLEETENFDLDIDTEIEKVGDRYYIKVIDTRVVKGKKYGNYQTIDGKNITGTKKGVCNLREEDGVLMYDYESILGKVKTKKVKEKVLGQ